jgi:chromosome segregation ATPase
MLLSGDELRVESSVDGRDLTRVTLARLKLAEAEAAVRSVPEAMAQRLGQGMDAIGQRIQRVESVLSSFRGSLGHPLARVESITTKLETLQGAIDALNQRLDAIEGRVSEEE